MSESESAERGRGKRSVLCICVQQQQQLCEKESAKKLFRPSFLIPPLSLCAEREDSRKNFTPRHRVVEGGRGGKKSAENCCLARVRSFKVNELIDLLCRVLRCILFEVDFTSAWTRELSCVADGRSFTFFAASSLSHPCAARRRLRDRVIYTQLISRASISRSLR